MAESHKKFITNTDTSSNSKISDFISNHNNNKKYNESENIQPHRQFFNSVTGALMPDGVDEADMYEVDLDDQREQEENQIEQYTDVSDKDKYADSFSSILCFKSTISSFRSEIFPFCSVICCL